MNQQSHGQHKAGHQHPGQANPSQLSPGSGTNAGEPSRAAGRLTAKRNEAVLGPFTARDVTVFASTLLLFVASLIPTFGAVYNLWNLGNLFFLGLGIILPLIVTALFVARRLSPGTKVRIGSLSVDQFASVVASFALAFFFLSVAGAFVPVMLVALIGSLVLFVATVPARFIPVFASDFLDRPEVPAHVVARESAVPFRKPTTPKPAKAAKAPKEAGAGPLAGWSKRITAGRAGATAVSTAAPAPPARAGQPGPAPTPVHTQGQSAGQPSEPAAPASPATQASPVVPVPAEQTQASPAAAAAPAPAAAAATQASPVVPSAAEQTRAGDVPVREGAPAGATSVSPAVTVPHASSGASSAHAAPAPAPVQAPAETMLHPQVTSQEPIGATVDPSSRSARQEEPVHEAFWFAVAQPRTAVDERTGMPAFVIEPGGWVLALEDRGNEFLVQHSDGRLGVLRDLTNIERG